MGLESLGYTNARDLFEAAREAAKDAQSKLNTLHAMESAEGARAQGVGLAPSGSVSDPMARVDARLMREEAWAKRIEDDYELIDEACWVLYGRDFSGGLDVLLGTSYADILYFRYLDYDSWDTVADKVGYSERQCRRYHDIALDYIDSNGLSETQRGEKTV